MNTYKIDFDPQTGIMRVAFGEPASNDQIVKDAKVLLDEMIVKGEMSGGAVLKVNGAASLPVAVVIAHAVAHLFGALAVFDPKLQKYVVSVSHGNDFKVGDLIE